MLDIICPVYNALFIDPIGDLQATHVTTLAFVKCKVQDGAWS